MNDELRTASHKTPIGWINLSLNAKGLVTGASLEERPKSKQTPPKAITAALDAYFTNGTPLPKELYVFPPELPPFTQQILRIIANVPFGKTITYTELAEQSGRPNAVRAAGTACGRNPIALFIPCHRVVHKTGEDLGYAWGPERKRSLLQHEGINVYTTA